MSVRPLRIAFFVDAFPDLSVTFIIDQVASLLERGHDVRVFALRAGRLDRQHPVVSRWNLLERTHYIGSERRGLPRLLEATGCLLARPILGGEWWRNRATSGAEGSLRAYRDLFALCRFPASADFDVAHCHFAPNGITALVLRRAGRLRAPVVTTFHGYDMRAGEASAGEVYATLREGGDRFLSISGYNRRLLEAWGFPSDRIVEHRVGIDLEEFPFRGARRGRGEEIRLLSVANLVPVKGHRYLIDALARLREDRPGIPFTLRIVGEGDQREDLTRRIREKDLGDRITLVGGLPRPQVLEELGRADVFLLPSLAEATPVALMEAQAVGLPVVATRVGSVDEVIADGRSGRLVPPADSAALAAAIGELGSRPQEWDGMGHAGRAHVATHYDLRRLVDRLEEIYREVSDPRTPKPPSASARA